MVVSALMFLSFLSSLCPQRRPYDQTHWSDALIDDAEPGLIHGQRKRKKL